MPAWLPRQNTERQVLLKERVELPRRELSQVQAELERLTVRRPGRAEPRRHGPWLRDVTRCRTEIVRERTREARRLEIQPWGAPRRPEQSKSSQRCRRELGRPSPAGTLRHQFLPRRAVPDAHRAWNSPPRSCQLSSIFSACRCQTSGLWSSSVSMVSTRSTMMSWSPAG